MFSFNNSFSFDAVRCSDGRLSKQIDSYCYEYLSSMIGEEHIISNYRNESVEYSFLQYDKQLLEGALRSKADVIFITEHDVLYHYSHFIIDHPVLDDTIYYKSNLWSVNKEGFRKIKKQRILFSAGYLKRKTLIEMLLIRIKKSLKKGAANVTEIGNDQHTKSKIKVARIEGEGICDIRHNSNYTGNDLSYFCQEKYYSSHSLFGEHSLLKDKLGLC